MHDEPRCMFIEFTMTAELCGRSDVGFYVDLGGNPVAICDKHAMVVVSLKLRKIPRDDFDRLIVASRVHNS